jgi:hypothetical protein
MKIILFFITSVPFDDFQVQGSRFRVQGSGFKGSGFRVQGSRLRVQRLQPMDTAHRVDQDSEFSLIFSLRS